MYFNTAPAAMQHVNFQREMGNYMQVWVMVVQEVEKAAENQIIEIIVGQQGWMEVSEAVPFNSPFQALTFTRSSFLSFLG